MNGTCNGPLFGSPPLGPSGGAKRSNIIKSELQNQFQRFFKSNFVYLLTHERYITYQKGFSFGQIKLLYLLSHLQVERNSFF